MNKEVFKLKLNVFIHKSGAVSIDKVRYGPNTGIARFIIEKGWEQKRNNRIAREKRRSL